MFRKIKRELSCLGGIKTRLIVLVAVAVVLGILTWVTCGNITVFRRLLRFPPFSAPIPVMFFLWIVMYALFGLLTALTTGVEKCRCSPLFPAVAGFFLALFWCPLFFGGRFAVSLSSLVLSLLAVILTSVRSGRFSAIVLALCVILGVTGIYFVYFTAGTAILN